MLCPEDFEVTPEMRLWAERTLPPTTAARVTDLTRRFVRKYREVERKYLADRGAWVALWKNSMEISAEYDPAARQGRGPALSDDSPSCEELERAGLLPPLKLPARTDGGTHTF